jgi:hypothetical protein
MKITRILMALTVITITSVTIFSQAKKAVAIVDMKVGGLMGGSENGKWLTPSLMAEKMAEKTEFVLAGLEGVEEGGVSWGTKEPMSTDICQDLFSFKFDLESDEGIAMGSTAKWNIVPRIPQGIALTNAAYKTIVANYLKSKGIRNPIVKITKAYRVDLEGDGKDEVLIVATRYKGGLTASAAVGDYSVILLRKMVGKTVVNYELAGEYVKKKIDFGAPMEFDISAIADLNGDGKMEIVTYGAYYEGESAGAYEIIGNRPVEVKELSVGCGV